MKKLLTLAVMVTALVLSSCKYDDDDIWNSVHGLEDRVAKFQPGIMEKAEVIIR